ncbi:hypothetical protein DIPPA_23754 [Diplonema papillatum]|nr:hypothetical protein DIPPA_23754 [Diplonema papillatum]
MLLLRLAAAAAALAVAAAQNPDCACRNDTETCCRDDDTWLCCTNTVSSCFEKEGTDPFPSRCCPRWMVGCDVGSVGCCDPSRPYQRRVILNTSTATPAPCPSSAAGNSVVTFYALVAQGHLPTQAQLTVYSMTGQGTVIGSRAVAGPAKDWYDGFRGQSTPLFPFDAKRVSFHFASGDTDTGVGLYTVNATDGSSTRVALNPPVQGYPLGMAYHSETDRFIYSLLVNGSYVFHSVNVSSGQQTPLGSTRMGESEADPSYYSGHISTIANDGRTILRLGYRNVSSQSVSGIGFATIGGANATVVWKELSADKTQFFYSIARLPDRDSFVSLAPSLATGSFAVVSWSLTAEPVILFKFQNAFPPAVSGVGPLGYVATTMVNGGFFAAMVVSYASNVVQEWSLITLELSTLTPSTCPISPVLLRYGTSLSGFGASDFSAVRP